MTTLSIGIALAVFLAIACYHLNNISNSLKVITLALAVMTKLDGKEEKE